VRQVGAQASYLSQNSLIESFGLGESTRVDSLEVIWPSGARQVRLAVSADQRLVVVEGQSPAGPPLAGPDPPVGTVDRERITEFWSRYRAATALRIAGKTEAAAAAYGGALELNPAHEDALYYLGNTRFALGEFAAAEQAWRRLVEQNRTSARAHSRLGSLYLCLEAGARFDPVRAEAEFRIAHEINKEETGPLLQLGEAALMRGDFAAAGNYLDAVVGANAASAAAHFYHGYLAWKTGAPDLAAKAFARAVAASLPPRAVLPEGASSEGDTKGPGTSTRSGPERCGALRRLGDHLGGLKPNDLAREMTARYRALDSLVGKGRRQDP